MGDAVEVQVATYVDVLIQLLILVWGGEASWLL